MLGTILARARGSGAALKREKELWAVSIFAIVVMASIGFLLMPLPNGQLAQSATPTRVAAVTPIATVTPVAKDHPRLGTNLRTVEDWSTQLPFLNLFKQARPWFTQCDPARDADCNGGWDTGEAAELDLDAHGWVRSLPAPEAPGFSIAATVLALPNTLPAGRYLLLYEGNGELRYRLGARLLEAESSPGRDLLEIDPARGVVHIQIYSTDPEGRGDYLRNLRLVREDREALLAAGDWFNPDFLARTSPYQVLRFMEWMRANGSPIEHWEQRARPEDAAYTGPAGVPPELMLALANRLGAGVWLTLPHLADDQYVEELARLTRDTLAADQPIYLEYSNEVWNSTFSQKAWVAEQADALWPGTQHSLFTKTVNWYGKRTAEVCERWKSVFGDAADRVICVMAGQAANPWVVQQALECPLWSEGAPCAAHGIDAITIANYFGGYLGSSNYEQTLQDWAGRGAEGLDLLFAELEEGGQLPDAPAQGALAQAADWLQRNIAVAEDFGLPVLGYEGGQHLVGVGLVVNNEAVTELFVSANRDPRMGQLYRRYLDDWQTAGGALLMHFSDIATPGRYGSWGALERVQESRSPKYDALKAYQRGPANLEVLRAPSSWRYLIEVLKRDASNQEASADDSADDTDYPLK